MSIAVAIISTHGGVVATDSAITRVDGSQTTDANKTFAIDDWLIGAHVGLLHFCGRDVADHVRLAIEGGSCPLEESARRIRRYFEIAFQKSDVNQDRCNVEFLLIGRIHRENAGLAIRTVEFKEGDFAASQSFFPWATTGDDAAKASVTLTLNTLGIELGSALPERLVQVAASSIEAGIKRSGPHPDWPQLKSCAGQVRLRLIQARVA